MALLRRAIYRTPVSTYVKEWAYDRTPETARSKTSYTLSWKMFLFGQPENKWMNEYMPESFKRA